MSDLFKVDLKKMLKGLEEALPLDEWPPEAMAWSSFAVQVGIMERLDLLIELQAMILGSGPTMPDGTVSKFLDRLNQHYGWRDEDKGA